MKMTWVQAVPETTERLPSDNRMSNGQASTDHVKGMIKLQKLLVGLLSLSHSLPSCLPVPVLS